MPSSQVDAIGKRVMGTASSSARSSAATLPEKSRSQRPLSQAVQRLH